MTTENEHTKERESVLQALPSESRCGSCNIRCSARVETVDERGPGWKCPSCNWWNWLPVDGWGKRLDAAALDAILAAAPQGSDWWFDGRDLFYKPEGTNLDQIIVPLPETWHESQEVPQAVGYLIAAAVNYLRAVRRGN